MKKYFIVSVLGFILASGCASTAVPILTKTNSVSPNQAIPDTASANTQVPGVPGNAGPTPGTIDQVPVVPMPDDANANTAKIRTERKIVDSPGSIPEPTRVPAAENSEVSSTMNKQGNFVESRFFKGNRQLIKVERTFADPKNSTLKIYLKSGKVVTVSGEKIQDFVGTSSAMYLELAGIKAPDVSSPATATKTK